MFTILCKRKVERQNLDIDYKILTKVLANQLKAVIEQIIHLDQTCSIPGHRIADTVQYVKDCYLSIALVSLDQERAFDNVLYMFMGRVLQRFGLGENFVLLY